MTALHVIALGLLGLHLYVRTLPPTPDPIPAPESAETAWWGLWPITYLPMWAVATGVIAVIASIFSYWLIELRRPQNNAKQTPDAARSIQSVLWVLSIVLFAAFFLFPIVHTRWGDAFILTKGIAFPDPTLRLTRSWQAPLDVALHSEVWLWFHEPFGWKDAMPVYRLLSPLAGALYLLAALALSRHPLLAPAWLPYGLLTTLGLMQLFFGYVENYSFAAAGVLAYLWLGLGVISGRQPLWLAATVLAVTHATHPSTIVLAPSLLYLGWLSVQRGWRNRATRNKTIGAVVLQIALPMMLVGGATFAFMEASGHGVAALLSTDRPGGGDARWFVPLFETTTRWEHYTMASWPHIRDWLNNQLLVAPIVLPSLVVAGVAWIQREKKIRRLRDWRVESGDSTVVRSLPISQSPNLQSPVSSLQSLRFLLIAAAFHLLFTFVWNPDYGGQRDWDLFSLAALPTTVLLALLLPNVLRGRALWGGVAPLIILQAWHTIAWIYQNTLPWQWPD
ncbi:MAG: hypothetical protein BroJett021_29510 [Chloroflexota bacterium]|nr:MAG: hypothetical protein BroJett021_29510 [Chloroflexota bacterium]